MATNNGLLRVSLAPLWHFFAIAAHDFLDHHLFNDFLSQHFGFFVDAAAFKNFCSFVVILYQRGSQWLAEFRPIAVQSVCLHAKRPT